jgi:hypothetical protein
MPRTLIAEEFDGTKLAKVAGFECGTDEWCRYAAEWIKAPVNLTGALKSMADHGTSVWLYFDEETDELVGFGSLGTTTWPGYGQASIIPQLAIQSKFHGQPKGQDEVRFSHQLLDDLIARANLLQPRRLVLTVDPRNAPAIKVYRDFGFAELTDRTRLGHVKMSLRLPDLMT